MSACSPSQSPPRVYVDLDRVLLPSGLTLECLVAAVRQRPAVLFLMAAWALRGPAFLKARLARDAKLDAASLPYRAGALAGLRREAESGVALGLVTSADETAARAVADHLEIFSDVVSSRESAGLRAGRKESALARKVAPASYEYRTERREAPPAAEIVKLLRPYQWLKNTLVFAPFLLAHHIRSTHAWIMALVAFAAISLCASGGYIVNDMLDRRQDRLHPRRRARPLASGAVSLGWGIGVLCAALAAAAGCALFLPWQCSIVLLWYVAAANFYSIVAKERVMADVIILALLYTTRLVLGAEATGNIVSAWLASFSVMLFVSLALCKRVAELLTWKSIRHANAPGRNYSAGDIPVLEMMAASSGFLACLIMVLYLQSADVLRLYRRPEYLWVGVVGLLYWLGRLMIYTHRGECPDDPLLFAVQDRTTLIVLAIAAIFVLLAV